MSVAQVVGYCISAFGLGYAGGALHRIWNKVIESVD